MGKRRVTGRKSKQVRSKGERTLTRRIAEMKRPVEVVLVRPTVVRPVKVAPTIARTRADLGHGDAFVAKIHQA